MVPFPARHAWWPDGSQPTGAPSYIVWGGCHQRHRYLAARRSFGPQTRLRAVLLIRAAVVVVDDEISGVPSIFSKSWIPSLEQIWTDFRLSLKFREWFLWHRMVLASHSLLCCRHWMDLNDVTCKKRFSSWENRQFGRSSKLFAMQCMEGACHRLQPKARESESGAKMSGWRVQRDISKCEDDNVSFGEPMWI